MGLSTLLKGNTGNFDAVSFPCVGKLMKKCSLQSISVNTAKNISLSSCLNAPISRADIKRIIAHRTNRPVRRALLYLPGNDTRKIYKIPTLDVDCAIMDCEDGVGLDKKEEARSTIAEMYDEISNRTTNEVGVRINSPGSGLAQKDIEAIFGKLPFPSCLVVPKIDEYQEMQWVCETLQDVMRSVCSPKQPPYGIVRIIFQTESAQGLMDLKKIIEAGIASCATKASSCLIDGVIFGSDDFCADLGISRTASAMELIYARQKIVTTAKAFGIQPIDMVYIDYKDNEGLKQQSIEGFNMGFEGKQIIHPNQIPVVQQTFVPDPQKLEWALQLIKAYEGNEKGAFSFQGLMIDLPTVLQAQNIVNIYNRINAKNKDAL